MKEQFLRKDRRGRGVTVLSHGIKQKCRAGVGGGGECTSWFDM